MITPGTAEGWTTFVIPGGSAPVPIVVLHRDPASRAQTMFVRFPARWSRPVAGFYEAAEELVVISGLLHMSGITYKPGDWGYIPARSVRTSTDTPEECVVFARFDGPARWREAAEAPGPSPITATLGGAPRVLRSSDESQASFGPLNPSEIAAADTEVLELERSAYAFVEAGKAFPAVEGACFIRTFGSASA